MTIKAAFTDLTNVNEAVAAVQNQLTTPKLKMVMYFASSEYAVQTLASAMKQAFPGAVVFGCTTAGELSSGRMTKKSMVAMGFTDDEIADVKIELVPKIDAENHVEEAFASFSRHYGTEALALDPAEYVGIILCDGLSLAEEKIMDSVGNMTNVTFIGGSAGDDLKFATTYVFADGMAYTDAAMLALIKPKTKFDFIKTQSFRTLPQTLKATKVDEEHRVVLEFDDKPALDAYAEALQVEPAEANKAFMRCPLGLMVDGEPYVRSPQQAAAGHMTFYCNVKEGMELSLLETTDIVADTAAVLKAKEQEVGAIRAIINFNCILRTLQLESQGRTEDYGKVFANIPTIGFSTYGEAYIGHINQTATMLIFY